VPFEQVVGRLQPERNWRRRRRDAWPWNGSTAARWELLL